MTSTTHAASPITRSWGRRWAALALGFTFAGALLAGCVGLDEQQRRWIFMATPASADAVLRARADGDLQDVWIEHVSAATGTHVKLHGLWSEGSDPKAPLLLYLHGAKRNVEASAWRIRDMQRLGFGVLAIDYRGFGLSTDELPSEALVDEDARAAWDWLAKKHPGRGRYVFGHSLGGAIAVRLASEEPQVKGLIVEGTFTSIADVFQTFKWGWLPITPLITQRFDSADRIAKVKAPVLVVHGSDDTLILPRLGRALFERALSPKRFVLVEGGNHYSTNVMGQAQYREALHELFGLGT